jgi:hypothetical protein
MIRISTIATVVITLFCFTLMDSGMAAVPKGTSVTSGLYSRGKASDSRVKAPAAPVCYITDSANNIVTTVSRSSLIQNDNQLPYYMWFTPSVFATQEKLLLKFNNNGVGLSKQIHKLTYTVTNGTFLVIGFAFTTEDTANGPALFKAKSDNDSCAYAFNVVP